MDYRSQGDTRVTINGSRHYKTPYGALPSVTTILSATQGNKAALERWAKKNPGGKEAAAARGTKVHSLMEEYLLGIDKDPVIEDKEIAQFWEGLPANLSKLENIIWAENPANQDDFSWTKGSDGISRVWHPGFVEDKNYGWAGAPDIVAEYKGQLVLGDLKTGTKRSNTSSFPITTAGYMNAYCQNNNCEPFDRLITFVDRESNPVEIKEFHYPVSTYETHLKIFQNYLEIYSFLNEKN